MSTVAVKSPNKKRKSLAGQGGTPAKSAKVENAKSPKQAKTPKKDIPLSNGKGISPKVNKTPQNAKVEKPKTPKKDVSLSEGGEISAKVKKTPQNKKENGVKGEEKKSTKVKGTKEPKRNVLLKRLQAEMETEGKDKVVKQLNEKLDAIISRSELTKTAKRKAKDLKQLIKKLTGEKVSVPTKSNEKKVKNAKSVQAKPAAVTAKLEKNAQKLSKKKAKGKAAASAEAVKVVEEKKPVVADDDEDDDESEDESGEEENAVEGEASGDEEEESDDDEDDDEEEDDDDDDDEEGSDEVEDKKEEEKVVPKEKSKPKQENVEKKKSRYVLFIGNLAYDTTKQELEDHFKRVGDIVDVRIPTERETNRPRGFGYVELATEAAYQQALDLNGSQLKNRKIKVEYTQGGNKNSENQKKDIKAKNFKLHAMRKQGQFGKGNQNQYRGKGKAY